MLSPVNWLVLTVLSVAQLANGNRLFQFSLDVGVKNQTIRIENNQVSGQDNAESLPRWTGEDKHKHQQTVLNKLNEIKSAVYNLNLELIPLVGRSDELAAKLKKTIRYINTVDTALESGSFELQTEQLRNFIVLVNTVRAPSRYGGVRTLEYVLLKLALEKYSLSRLYDEVFIYLQESEAAWRRFKNTQTMILDT